MTDFVWDPDKPLNRYKPESKKAHAAFLEYVGMQGGRSLRALTERYVRLGASDSLTRPPTTKWGTLTTWSALFAWPARAARADELQREADEIALREERLARERRRMERREQWEDEEWSLSQEMNKLARDILKEAPNFLGTKQRVVHGRNGQPDQLIITVSLDGNMAVKAGDLASKLARLSTGSPTDSVEIKDDLTDEARAERITALLDRARERRDRQADSGAGGGTGGGTGSEGSAGGS